MWMYSNNLICDILLYIDENITDKITVEELENKFFYNRYYIMKLFKKEMNITLINYMNSLRIYKAIILIKETDNNLLNIAFKCGFYSIEYFSETFKTIIGVNPRTANNYLRRKKTIKQHQIDIISNSILRLYSLKDFKNRYLSKRKPDKLPIKKLTIFK